MNQPRRLLTALAACTLLAACQSAPPAGQPWSYAAAARGTGRVALTPRYVQPQARPAARRLMAQVAPRTVADIDHVEVRFVKVLAGTEYDQGTITLQQDELFNTVVVGDLANDTLYRFIATAYTAGGEAISDAAGSTVDLQVERDDALVAGELKVRLKDVAFNGRATSSGLDIEEGDYIQPGSTAVRVTPRRGVDTVAGNGSPGDADSEGDGGRVDLPGGLTADAEGNVWIADTGNHMIRRIDADGELRTLTGGPGPGTADGDFTEAFFNAPADLALTADGATMYVVDAGSGSLRALNLDAHDVATPVTGLVNPHGVAVTADGHVWVANTDRHTVLEFDPADWSAPLRVFGSNNAPDFVDDAVQAARFDRPWGLAVGPDGQVYVADRGNHAVRRIQANGDVFTFVGDGTPGNETGNGEDDDARLNDPTDLAFDTDRVLYVLESAPDRVRKVEAHNSTHIHAGQTNANAYADTADPRDAYFKNPLGLAVDYNGLLFVGDTDNHRIRRIQEKGRNP